MPTLNDLFEAVKRQGGLKVASVAFGVFCLVAINLFRSTPGIDLGGNVLFGVLIAIAMLIPNRKE
jgi:putative exporter of polyketide antibiotics